MPQPTSSISTRSRPLFMGSSRSKICRVGCTVKTARSQHFQSIISPRRLWRCKSTRTRSSLLGRALRARVAAEQEGQGNRRDVTVCIRSHVCRSGRSTGKVDPMLRMHQTRQRRLSPYNHGTASESAVSPMPAASRVGLHERKRLSFSRAVTCTRITTRCPSGPMKGWRAT